MGVWEVGKAGVSCATDPRGCDENVEGFLAYASQNPGEVASQMWNAVKDPIVQDWQSGNQGEAIGRGVAGIAEVFVGTKGLSKIRYASKLDNAAPNTSTSTALVPYRYPPNRGFLGEPVTETLRPGTRIDRFGGERGTFASPEGTPFAERALRPDASSAPYGVYELRQPLDVQAGTTAPWFGSGGGGIQYELPTSVGDLIEAGILKRVN
jgi:hypothetical protein